MIRRRHLGFVAALVTLAVLGGSGAAVATWTASASATGSASSATVKASLTQAGLTPAAAQQYATGTAPQVLGSLTLKNEGTAPLSYALALSVTGDATLAAKTSLTLWTAASCGSAIGADAVRTTLADTAPALPAAARQLAAGSTKVVCIATQISGTDGTTTNAALQGRHLEATFTATGTVGAWAAAAPAASFSQSVYRLAAPAGTLGCTESNRAVTLTWNAPANRPAGKAITYRLVNTATKATLKTVTSSSATVSQALQPGDFSSNGAYALTIVASEADFGTSAPETASFTITRTSPFGWDFFLQRLECP
ncbi:hypothetical protein AB3M83_00835 [Microbacterium sp. 179-B 1A2 NHS]|uniref:hypothetical protein n=1 Tax=Microbacterium sp. 179-B 1A2 NHS TaxID=3142383 RepID=UPI0039A3A644